MINKKRYAQARDRAYNINDQDQTIDKFITERFVELVLEQKRPFQKALIIGDKNYFTEKCLNNIGIKNISHIDISNKYYDIDKNQKVTYLPENEEIGDVGNFDLILGLSLVNFIEDIPKFLKQIKNNLDPGGLLLLNFFSENNLIELKEMFYETELDLYDGISQRFMPVIDIREIGNLINSIGYSDTVVSRENINYSYACFNNMLEHLRLMACTNFLNTKDNKIINKKYINNLIKYFENRKINGVFNLTYSILITNSWKK
jgi:SAM-dependent methyltransferase